jgi:hypothetical protein
MRKLKSASLEKQNQKNSFVKQVLLPMRFFTCILAAGVALFAYIEKQNELTELRLAIPTLAKEVKNIHEENNRLKYEIDSFESPIHLMELVRKPEFGHLKHPYLNDEIFLTKNASLEKDQRNSSSSR